MKKQQVVKTGGENPASDRYHRRRVEMQVFLKVGQTDFSMTVRTLPELHLHWSWVNPLAIVQDQKDHRSCRRIEKISKRLNILFDIVLFQSGGHGSYGSVLVSSS